MYKTPTKGSSLFAFPDICKVPFKAGPIPMPYPVGISTQTKIVHKIKSISESPPLKGDEAGLFIVQPKVNIEGQARVGMTKLMDYQYGELISPNSGLMCHAPNCRDIAEAYLPKNGLPVCLKCYKINMKDAYPLPSQRKVKISS